MEIDELKIPMEQALRQIEKNCYDEMKVPGSKSKLRVPNKKKVREYLQILVTCMEPDDWQKVAKAYSDFAIDKARNRKGRPATEHAGLAGGARTASEREAAAKAGVWHTRFPNGCIGCGSCDYRHATGGLCNRCYSTIRRLGISSKQFRDRIKSSG